MFDPEIERTTQKLIKEKVKVRSLDLEESSVLKYEHMVDANKNN